MPFWLGNIHSAYHNAEIFLSPLSTYKFEDMFSDRHFVQSIFKLIQGQNDSSWPIVLSSIAFFAVSFFTTWSSRSDAEQVTWNKWKGGQK